MHCDNLPMPFALNEIKSEDRFCTKIKPWLHTLHFNFLCIDFALTHFFLNSEFALILGISAMQGIYTNKSFLIVGTCTN